MKRIITAIFLAPVLGILSIIGPLTLAASIYGGRSELVDGLAVAIILLLYVFPLVAASSILIALLNKYICQHLWKILPSAGALLIGIEFTIMSWLDNYFSPPGINWEWALSGLAIGATTGFFAAWILSKPKSILNDLS